MLESKSHSSDGMHALVDAPLDANGVTFK